MKKTKWTVKKADKLFREKILERDKKCQHPDPNHSSQLQVSHFFGRSISSTRFDFDNCILLCAFHHYWSPQLAWEERKGGIYRDYMLERLGGKRFYALCERAKLHMKQQDAIEEFVSKFL